MSLRWIAPRGSTASSTELSLTDQSSRTTGSGVEPGPSVSFAMPVFNGAQTIRRAVDSLLAQTLCDIEVVISDNASDDDTQQICTEYARTDSRVRYFRNATNIGQIANFNRALELSRGRYVRWIGCNDWLEPTYAERCVELLDRRLEIIAVSTYQKHHGVDETAFYQEYTGLRVDSTAPHQRFVRMLWFLQASRYIFDPVYCLIRRDALDQSSRLRMVMGTDRILAAELSLLGPFGHVPRCLSHRVITPNTPEDVLARRFDPSRKRAGWWNVRMCFTFADLAMRFPMSWWGRIVCLGGVARFLVKHGFRRTKRTLRKTARWVLAPVRGGKNCIRAERTGTTVVNERRCVGADASVE